MLLVRETLTAFVTEQNRSQWFSTDTYTSCIITPMLMLKSTVCVRGGWVLPCVALWRTQKLPSDALGHLQERGLRVLWGSASFNPAEEAKDLEDWGGRLSQTNLEVTHIIFIHVSLARTLPHSVSQWKGRWEMQSSWMPRKKENELGEHWLSLPHFPRKS